MIKKDLKEFGFILWITITVFLIFYIIISKVTFKVDEDYKKLDLALESYNINYYTVYEDDALMKYKVYKLNTIGENEKFRNKLEKSSYWSKNKFYEYEMKRFYDEVGEERTELDRENLYYYDNKGIYAILDLKNEKLYYLKSYIYGTHNNYSNILGVKTENYIKREIYSVREGIQYDGLDYYVYEFLFEEVPALKVKRFDRLNEEWLEFIKKNRSKGGLQHDYDVVIGPVADDNTMETVQLYMANILTAEEAVERLRYNKVNNQVSFHTERALQYVKLVRRVSYARKDI